MQREGECSRRSQRGRGAEPVSALLRVRVLQGRGGEAEEVSVKVLVMEKGALRSAGLWVE